MSEDKRLGEQQPLSTDEHIASFPKVCNTDGKPLAADHREINPLTGQQKEYMALCPDERAKGFVRPYRDMYKHVGHFIERCEATQKNDDDENPHQCTRRFPHDGEHEFDALMLVNKPIKTLMQREGGCGATTTMHKAIAETYARDPHFYSGTFCVHCQTHRPLTEFTWMDGTQVGS